MKTRTLIVGTVSVLLLVDTRLPAADATLLVSKPGSKMRIEGTSSFHDWQAETPFIAGSLDAGADFPTDPGQAVSAGKVNGKAEIFVSVRSLKSVKPNGKPYDDKMDEVMWDKLKAQQNPKIIYRTSELVLKEAPKSKDAPYVLDSKGELLVGGVTNRISMPVNVMPLGDKRLKISGSTKVKMTDFGIKPVEKSIGPITIKTGDDVKILFEWVVGPKPPVAAASQ